MKGLEFYSILDFFPNRKLIKKEYKKLTTDEIILYRKYVYSICFENEYIKDLIWEYLNEWEDSEFKLGEEWRKKKRRAKINENNNTF